MNFFLWSKKVYEYGFKYSSWNFLEASHGKGAADGIGTAIKRAADHQVNVKGLDIACADDLLNYVQPTSSVKLFLINESPINTMKMLLPSTLIPIPSTMKLHQLTTFRRGEVSCRVLSCFCDHPTVCSCFQPFTVKFPDTSTATTENTDNIDDLTATGPSSVKEVEQQSSSASTTAGSNGLVPIDCVDESLIGQYCVVVYDSLPYPCLVMDVDDEEELEIKVMCRIGANRFFWPLPEDRLWYSKNDIITLLDNEPELVTTRHRQIPPLLWKLLIEELDLDEQGKHIK